MLENPFEKVALNKILKELYAQKNNIEDINKIDTGESTYKNFVKDSKRDLELILSSLGVKVENFKSSNGRYKIPRITGEMFKAYLLEEGKKGSIISKIRTKDLSSIGKKERIEFSNRLLDRLEYNFSDNEDYKNQLIELKKNTIEGIDYFFDINDLVDKILENIRNVVEQKVRMILKVDKTIGLNHLNDCIGELQTINCKEDIDNLINSNDEPLIDLSNDCEVLEFSEEFSNIAEKIRLYSLDKSDVKALIEVLEKRINKTIIEWEEIVDIASYIRSDNVEELNFMGISVSDLKNDVSKEKVLIKSKELAEKAEIEYESELKAELRWKEIEEENLKIGNAFLEARYEEQLRKEKELSKKKKNEKKKEKNAKKNKKVQKRKNR